MNRASWSWYGTVLLLLSTLLSAACGGEREQRGSGEPSEEEKRGGTAVVCYQAGFDALNPFVSPSLGSADLRLLLFTPLVLYGEGGEYRPYLATDWQWENRQRRLTMRIRQDVTWHDGAPVTAGDVAWTLQSAADPDYGYLSDDFSRLERATAVDSVTVELTFTEPFTLGLEPFVGLPILPRHLLADIPVGAFKSAEYHRAPVGSGPFEFLERRPDGALVFEPSGAFPPSLGRPYLGRIVLRTISEATTVLAELRTGNVDLCLTGSALAQRAEAGTNLQLLALDPPQSQVIPLNTRFEPLSDVRVRRALSAALRRADVAAAISPAARPARNPLPESSPWFAADLVQPDADSMLAASLLDDAGWLRSDGIRRNAHGEELRIPLVAPWPLEASMTVVQAQLRRLGVAVDLRFMEWASYVGVLQDPDARPAAMALGFSPDKVFSPAGDLYSEFHTEGFSNLGSYSSAVMDSLLELLQTPLGHDEQLSAYREVQRLVAQDVPMVFTVYAPRVALSNDRLRGVIMDLNGPFATVTHWWLPPERRR